MNDKELGQFLRQHLAAGQDEGAARQAEAWRQLRSKLPADAGIVGREDHNATWNSWAMPWLSAAACAVLALIITLQVVQPSANTTRIAFAQAEQDNLWVSAFYSETAKADVVWITGLDAVADN